MDVFGDGWGEGNEFGGGDAGVGDREELGEAFFGGVVGGAESINVVADFMKENIVEVESGDGVEVHAADPWISEKEYAFAPVATGDGNGTAPGEELFFGSG